MLKTLINKIVICSSVCGIPLLSGCSIQFSDDAVEVTNNKYIAETKKCEAAGMNAEYASGAIWCMPKSAEQKTCEAHNGIVSISKWDNTVTCQLDTRTAKKGNSNAHR